MQILTSSSQIHLDFRRCHANQGMQIRYGLPKMPRPRLRCAEKDGNKHIGLDIKRVQYWLSVGAQPTKTVARLLGQAAVIPKPPPPQSQQRGTKKDLKAAK